MILCVCKALSERVLRESIRAGARSLEDLARLTGATTDCGTCAEHLAELLAEELAKDPSPVALRPSQEAE